MIKGKLKVKPEILKMFLGVDTEESVVEDTRDEDTCNNDNTNNTEDDRGIVESFVDTDSNNKKKDDGFTKIIKSGEHIEVVTVAHMPVAPKTTKVGKGKFKRNDTGKVFSSKQASDKSESPQSIKRSMQRLRHDVWANCTEDGRSLFVTLTYKDCMKDFDLLSYHFKLFEKKLSRWVVEHYGADHKYKFIRVSEIQERGAWHIHVVFIFPFKVDIPPKVFSDSWTHGFIYIKEVYNVEGLGWYLSKDKDWKMYPSSKNVYSKSAGLKKPEITKMTLKEYKAQKPHHGKLTYEVSKEIKEQIIDSETGEVQEITVNSIDYKHYTVVGERVISE